MALVSLKENLGLPKPVQFTPDSPLARSILGAVHTPGKTPTNQQFKRRTPGSSNSDMSMDESLSTGLTPGKHLCQSSLLENFGSIGGECSGILHNLDGLSMATDMDTSPLNDSGLGLSPLSPNDAHLTGSSPRPPHGSEPLMEMLATDAGVGPHAHFREAPRLEPFKVTNSPLHTTSSPPDPYASHDPMLASRLTTQISKRKLLHEEVRRDEALLLHNRPHTAFSHSQAYLPLTNNPGRLPLTMNHPTLVLRDPESGKRDKTSLSQAQGPCPKKAASNAKRGEYRCGKCGFFPKKTKHNCTTERARRQAQGEFVPGDKPLKKTPLSMRTSLDSSHHAHQPEPLSRVTATLVSQALTSAGARSADPILASYNEVEVNYGI